MKKLQLIIYLFISIEIFSQNHQLDFGDFPRPIPSTSYNVTYQEMPRSTATGVPNISIPLGGLSSQGDKIGENITLSYNPYNVNDEDFVSDVGLGWTLFSGGSISRQIVGGLDEQFDNTAASNYNLNSFDDLYYYNLPNGVSGKFKIYRNVSDNTFTILNYDRNSVKMEFTRTSNTATLIVNSFTLTDDKGYKFIFNDYSQSLYTSGNKVYRSAFYLSSIKDATGAELFTYEYLKHYQYIDTTTLLYQNCKLKNVNSIGLGKIDIEYAYDPSLKLTMNDPYNISKIKGQNNYGKNLFEYSFEYIFQYYPNLINQKRVLNKISKKNFENPNSPEVTKFEYYTSALDDNITMPNLTTLSCMDSETQRYPANSVIGILKKIHLPTGGIIEYEFEPNEYFFDKNSPTYIQSLQENYKDSAIQSIEPIGEFNYSNTHTTGLARWTLQGDPTKPKKIYFVFNAFRNPDNPFLPENPGYLHSGFNLDGNNSNSFATCGTMYADEYSYSVTVSSLVNPGKHTFQFPGIWESGTVSIYELKNAPPPYKNIDYTYGVRIKKEKHFNSSTSTAADKTISYLYNSFDDNNSSSGYKFANENIYSSSEFVLYKNVKISEGEDMGYINNYFKLPSDYPDTYTTIGGIQHPVKNYYNLTQSGLLSKKSIFDNNDNKIKEFIYDYELQQSNGIVEIATGYGYMRMGVIKKLKLQETDFLANKIIINKRESNYENKFRFNNISSTKEINSDGTVIETIYSYPNPLTLVGQTNEYQHLIDNNIKGIPIQIIEKKDGAVVSTAETKFANNSLYPTSVISKNAFDGSIKTAIRYDKYDSKGNLLQYTTNIDESTGLGFPTTLVYGYNQTLPIAKIEGATTGDLKLILTPVGSPGIVALSNQDVDDASEKLLMEGLDEYRNNVKLKDFMVTTFTYDPLIGITSVTPPNGIREIYKYDTNGKLKLVVDVNGNILTEYKYNVKPQP